MKRLVTGMLSVFLLAGTLSGCQAGGGKEKTAQQKLSGSFSTTVTMELQDLEATGVLTRYGADVWNATFSEPFSLSGVSLDFVDGEVTASYKGLSFSVPQAAMPVKSILLDFIDLIDQLAMEDTISGNYEDHTILLEGETETGSYRLTLQEDGSLSGFTVENMGANLYFSDFSTQVQTEQATEESSECSETEPGAESETDTGTDSIPEQAESGQKDAATE